MDMTSMHYVIDSKERFCNLDWGLHRGPCFSYGRLDCVMRANIGFIIIGACHLCDDLIRLNPARHALSI